MKYVLMVAAMLALSTSAFAQQPSFFIEPHDGFENYLNAALINNKVPVTLVLDEDKATYVVRMAERSTANQGGSAAGNGSLLFPVKVKTRNNDSVGISIIDPKTSEVIYAYSSSRSETHDAAKQLAEDWAKQLKKEMEKKKGGIEFHP